MKLPMHFALVTCLTAVFCLAAAAPHASAAANTDADNKIKIILDTDIGDDIDDAYALACLATVPECKLLGVTTTYGHTDQRAQIAGKLLKLMGRTDVPVYAGKASNHDIGRQYQWAKSYTGSNIKKGTAVEFLKKSIEKEPGQITILAIGSLTNIGELVTKYPSVVPQIKRIVIMGGSVYTGYGTSKVPQIEWNIRCDPPAARAVFSCGAVITVAGLEATAMMQFDAERQKRLFAIGTPTTDALAALTNLWGGGTPTQFDVMAVANALGHNFCELEKMHISVTDDGMTHKSEGPINAELLINPNKEPFLDWYIHALTPQSAP
jgi:purine nucleosidase